MTSMDDGTTSTTTQADDAPRSIRAEWAALSGETADLRPFERLVVDALPTGTDVASDVLLARIDLIAYAAHFVAQGRPKRADALVASAADAGLDEDERRAIFAALCKADDEAGLVRHTAALLVGQRAAA